MSNSDLDHQRHRLQKYLDGATPSERPGIIYRAIEGGKALAKSGKFRMAEFYDMVAVEMRKHEITLEQVLATKPAKAGFFQSLPTDDGPRAA